MKLATQRRFVVSLLLLLFSANAAQARQQAPSPPATVAAAGVWDWLENALTGTPTAAPVTVADLSIPALWRLRSVDGAPASAVAVVRQYTSRPDGFLGMVEVTIDGRSVPRFRLYSARVGAAGAIYTDESFARFLLNGTRTENTVSIRLVDRNTVSLTMAAGAKPARQSLLTVSADGATLTEVTEILDGAGGSSSRETLVFGKQTGPDPIRLPAPAAPPELAALSSGGPASPQFNPLLGTWAMNEAKSTAKPEAGSVTLLRFIDLGKGAFGTLMARVSVGGVPSLEMAAVKFGGPDDLILALPVFALPQIQIFLERDALPPSAVAYKMIDARTVESMARSLSTGKTSAITTRHFTETFMEFTETRKALDALGKPAGESITVYSKVAP